jgi:small GTP-binding protein
MADWLSSSIPVVKVVLLGESSVGKTSIVSVAHGDPYSADQTATVGACFVIKNMSVGDSELRLHIWDTAGQERFRTLAPMYYRDAQFVLLVYAIDNVESFKKLESWRVEIVKECDPLPHMFIVGNKSDLENARAVQTVLGTRYAETYDAKFYEVSAQNHPEGITKMFEDIARQVIQEGQEVNAPDTVNLNATRKKGKKCPC